MFTITRELDFCYGHRLLTHPGKCRFLHGHNGRVEILIRAGTLDDQGMVMDFGTVRATLEAWVEAELDHHTILCARDPLVEVLRAAGQRVFVLDTPPTAENIARKICEQGRNMGLDIIEVRLWETPRCMAAYRPAG